MQRRFAQALDVDLLPLAKDPSYLVLDPPEPLRPDLIPPSQAHVVVRSAVKDHANRMAGYTTLSHLSGDAIFDVAVVCIGRARAANRMRIGQAARHLAPDGLLLVDGQKTDGIEPLLKDCKALTWIVDSFPKAHGRLFWIRAEDAKALIPWADLAEAWPKVDGFETGPGVFSADSVDPGSAYLTSHLPKDLKGVGADLGAGWGYLSAHVLQGSGVDLVHLVEDDHLALEAAKRNLLDPRAEFHWADACAWRPSKPLDFVVMNPPFHAGRAVDLGLSRDFIATAAQSLARHGTLWLVANRHLPYEDCLDHHFAQVTAIAAGQGYKVIKASAPRAGKGGHRP